MSKTGRSSRIPIEAPARLRGVDRAERQRLFWERVATGHRKPRMPWKRSHPYPSAWAVSSGSSESLELALVTLLTVMVFGLGWATLELEGIRGQSGYVLASSGVGFSTVGTSGDLWSTTTRTAPSERDAWIEKSRIDETRSER